MNTLIMAYGSPAIENLLPLLKELAGTESTPDWLIDVAAFCAGMAPLMSQLDRETEAHAFLKALVSKAQENPAKLYVFTAAADQLVELTGKHLEI